MSSNIVPPSWIRGEIVRRILGTLEATMPIYQQMMGVANDINAQAGVAEAKRLGRIMHAAIRCASDEELHTIADLFSLLNCEPVNYYDLRERVSVESTAFRPTTKEEMELNGFRVFCSRLSLECIPQQHQEFVRQLIARRHVFSAALLQLIEIGKARGGFREEQAEQFIKLCVQVFTRPQAALISLAEYHQLQQINKVACQVLVSNALAFNHLTPSVASVPAAHQEMSRRGIKTIPVWQGPVGKDVILRQTSCLAPPVTLRFPEPEGGFTTAEYQETFVEFEERLQALTPRGRTLFEAKFEQGKQSLQRQESDPDYSEHYYATMREALADFPSDPNELWRQQLAYFTFEKTEMVSPTNQASDWQNLIEAGCVRLIPQQYEDFFGPAATNIFNSNIGLPDVSNVGLAKSNSQQAFEAGLGKAVINMYDYYEQIQADSQREVQRQLSTD